MSRYTIEKVLWDLVRQPQTGPEFRTNPDPHLDRYPLDPSERNLLKQMDVQAISALGINPMLLMRAYQMVFGKDQLPQYLQRMGENR
jgi:hypothetical protein